MISISVFCAMSDPSRKHAYSNILKILPPKIWKFSDKNSDIFHISAQNIDCGYPLEPPRRGGSNKYPQSLFAPVNLSFTILKWGLSGSKLYRCVFVMLIILSRTYAEAVLTSTHNLCFWAEIRKIMYAPVNLSFTILKWGLSGSKLYRCVFVMLIILSRTYE